MQKLGSHSMAQPGGPYKQQKNYGGEQKKEKEKMIETMKLFIVLY
jgi:hypothetical protein